MTRDVRRTQRAAAVLGLMEQRARVELETANAKLAELQTAQDDILAVLANGGAGLFDDVFATRLCRASAHLQQQQIASAATLATWRQRHQRTLAAARNHDVARMKAAVAIEQRELNDLLEQIQNANVQGPCKS